MKSYQVKYYNKVLYHASKDALKNQAEPRVPRLCGWRFLLAKLVSIFGKPHPLAIYTDRAWVYWNILRRDTLLAGNIPYWVLITWNPMRGRYYVQV